MVERYHINLNIKNNWYAYFAIIPTLLMFSHKWKMILGYKWWFYFSLVEIEGEKMGQVNNQWVMNV